ncbi:hypothetical protein SUGI_0786770 [Cryptomeria japonica]|uniref:probable phytol kinase 2, chloroplastic n=1 Tax=Cryptomeria japonica TaxID=3369 RepID=UPI002414A59B|nr:probable phytol kinase 2, chloroplastic [Cryptomeria japonica]GLJ38589.1 hypothetical protein SUGI_0786770 [Cryptomeria japonica]
MSPQLGIAVLTSNSSAYSTYNIIYPYASTRQKISPAKNCNAYSSLVRRFSGNSTNFSGSQLKSRHRLFSLVMGASQVGCSQSGGGEICSAKPEDFINFAGLSISMFSTQDQNVHDIIVSVLTAFVALGCLRFWDEMAKRNVFEQKLNRKFVHISIGLVFMLFWPLFSTGPQAPYLAALAPGVNIFRMIGLGSGIMKNEAMVKSMSRNGDARELLKGPLYYACTLTFITILFWRTSPIAPAAIANLCAGDGFADIAGRRLGTTKLPYNKNKSFAGSLAMLIMGFTVSVGYMFYFSSFGYYEVNLKMVFSALFVSTAATFIESLPISTDIDDNLTVSLCSALVGFLIF